MKKSLIVLSAALALTACSSVTKVNLVCFNPTSGVKTVEYQGASWAHYKHNSRTWVIRYSASDDADAGVVMYQQAQGEACASYEVK